MPARKKQQEEEPEEQTEGNGDEENVEDEAEGMEGVFDISIGDDEISVTVSRDEDAAEHLKSVAKLVEGL